MHDAKQFCFNLCLRRAPCVDDHSIAFIGAFHGNCVTRNAFLPVLDWHLPTDNAV